MKKKKKKLPGLHWQSGGALCMGHGVQSLVGELRCHTPLDIVQGKKKKKAKFQSHAEIHTHTHTHSIRISDSMTIVRY